MVSSISSNISSLQLLRAQNAFNQAKTLSKPEEQISPIVEEENQENKTTVKSATTVERLQDKIVDEIRNDLTSINNEITDEDIKYGLTFGRSVLVDCSA